MSQAAAQPKARSRKRHLYQVYIISAGFNATGKRK